MPLRVYNTATRQKEEFTPRTLGQVAAYVCGVTPYSYAHIGNARPPVVWDTFQRWLQYRGYAVTLLTNFTDVDDKIIRASQETGQDPLQLSRHFSEVYLKDLAGLGVRPAQRYPRVSEEMDAIIGMVEELVRKEHAYEVAGDVYFDVSTFPRYGQFSGRNLDDLQSGARVEVDERKRSPLDFALWKTAKPGEPAWDSPWGKGRPGWHIECSAMSMKYLGNGFDLHGGGLDLIFPHHENEVAQSEAFTGEGQMCGYWLHNGLLNISGERMGKSMGNALTIHEVLKRFPGEVVRFYLLSTHYRSPLEWSEDLLADASKGLERLRNAHLTALRKVAGAVAPQNSETLNTPFGQRIDGLVQRFGEAMDDDFNTALAIGILFDMAREMNTLANDSSFGSGTTPLELAYADQQLKELGGVLGLLEAEESAKDELVDPLMQLILEIRQSARQKKDWPTADQIRNGLGALGIVIEDTPQGPVWKHKT